MSDFSGPMDSPSAGPARSVLVPSSSLLGRRPELRGDFAREESGYSARAVLSVLGRHKSLIIGCVCLLTLISAIISFALTPRYVAESLVILDTRRPEIVQQSTVLANLVSGSTADPAIVRSEVALINSPAYARKVIDNLDLLHNPVFQREVNPEVGSDGLSRAVQFLRSTLASLFPDRESSAGTSTEMGRAIGAFKQRLVVYNDDRSYAISLRYESQNPQFATMVVNSLAQIYIADQLASKQAVAHRAVAWLKGRLEVLQAEVQASERKVADFQAQNHLDTVLSGTLTEQRLHGLNAQLMATSNDVAQKEASLAQIQDMLHSPGGAAAASQVLASPLIQKLREQEADAAARVAALSKAYNAVYPGGEPRKREFEQRINAEIRRIVTGLSGDISAGRARIEALKEAIRQEQGKLDAVNSARVELTKLQHDASTSRNLYDSLLLRSQQVEADEQSLQTDARVVPAETPTQPSFPRKLLFIAFGFFGSVFIGILLAFFVEQLDESLRSPEDAERLTGVPALGIVPRVRNGSRALAAIVDSPLSAYAEAINNVLIALRAGAALGANRVIAITSAVPNEGKTVIASALARSAATAGTRTLLMDCDMRRPMVGKLFGQAATPAIETMFKQKTIDFSRFVKKDESSGLHYLAARRMTSNPQEILGSQWMDELIVWARSEYDLVVLDTPPLLTVSDALHLSRVTDATLLVVRWGHTPSRLIAEALRLLQLSGKSSLGTILSLVDMRKYLHYRSGGYYYGASLRRSLTTRDAY
ncbi:MAG: polysaccharide biosynthesis tyrosine autokinase [Rhodopila sp.]|nr:polysaccharide biosynthesis tyrosine autokinase [Rhodopila sp.]